MLLHIRRLFSCEGHDRDISWPRNSFYLHTALVACLFYIVPLFNYVQSLRLNFIYCHYVLSPPFRFSFTFTSQLCYCPRDISLQGRCAATHVVSRQGFAEYELRIHVGSGHTRRGVHWCTLLHFRRGLSEVARVDHQTRRLGHHQQHVGPSCISGAIGLGVGARLKVDSAGIGHTIVRGTKEATQQALGSLCGYIWSRDHLPNEWHR